MGKVSPQNARIIRQIVLDCSIKRLTSHETAEILRQEGFPVEVRTVDRYKTRIRHSSQQWIAILAKNRRGEYIAEYKERIDELRAYQQKLWTIADNTTSDRTKVEAVHELIQCTQQLAAFYDALPLINAIKEYDNGNGSNNNDDGSFAVNGGSCSRHCSDFDDEEDRYRCDFHSQQYEIEHGHGHNN